MLIWGPGAPHLNRGLNGLAGCHSPATQCNQPAADQHTCPLSRARAAVHPSQQPRYDRALRLVALLANSREHPQRCAHGGGSDTFCC